jgi:hypothetical protein
VRLSVLAMRVVTVEEGRIVGRCDSVMNGLRVDDILNIKSKLPLPFRSMSSLVSTAVPRCVVPLVPDRKRMKVRNSTAPDKGNAWG